MAMMSDATEFALWKLHKGGDRKPAEKRLQELGKTRQVQEYLALTEELEATTTVRQAQEEGRAA